MHRFITAALLALTVGTACASADIQDLARQLTMSQYPSQVEKLLKAGRTADAIELADIGLAKNEADVQLRFIRACALETAGRTDEAVKVLNSLIAAYPEIPEPYNNLAVIEAGRGQLEEARRLLSDALVINPEFALARKNLGDIYVALAREAYEAAAPKLPNNTALQKRLEAIQALP